MESELKRCSTPLIGRKTDLPNLPWSEIRGANKTGREKRVCSLPGIKLTKSKQRRQKNIRNDTETKNNGDNNNNNPNSNSVYQVISEDEIGELKLQTVSNSPKNVNLRGNWLNSFDVGDENSSQNYSLPSPEPLFYSPGEKKYDEYAKSYIHDEKSMLSELKLISSPEFQSRFNDTSSLKTYSNRYIKKRKLSPSQISFSPKWVNKVASKIQLSNDDVPSKNVASITRSTENSAGTDWSSKSMSYTANELWDNFARSLGPSNEQSPEKQRSKYSHLQFENKKLKRLTTVNRTGGEIPNYFYINYPFLIRYHSCRYYASVESDKENIPAQRSDSSNDTDRSMAPLRKHLSPNIRAWNESSSKVVTPHSRKPPVKWRTESSPKDDTKKFPDEFQLDETFEIRSDSKMGSPVKKQLEPKVTPVKTVKSSVVLTSNSFKKQSKPKIMSVEIIKNPITIIKL